MRVQTEPRHRIDWVHVQRDYATGRFRAAGSLDQAEAARLAALLREGWMSVVMPKRLLRTWSMLKRENFRNRSVTVNANTI